MKIKATFVLSMLAVLMLLSMLLGAVPVQSVQAEAAESPLAASGDFAWAKGMGGASYEYVSDMVVDSRGIYTIGGFFDTADFDPGSNVFNLTSLGDNDIFVSKLNKDGSFAWAIGIGSTGYLEYANDVTLDASGNVYVTGTFGGIIDFNPGMEVFNLTSKGSQDIFILKLDGNGNFMWAKSMRGADSNSYGGGGSIALDSIGNIYTTGQFAGIVDFDPGAGVFNVASTMYGSNAFVSKLNNNGGFVWAKSMGVAILDGSTTFPSVSGGNIIIDENGDVYTVGGFSGTVDFDPGAGTFNLTGGYLGSGFLSKLDGNGNFLWAKDMGLGISGIDLDSNQIIYVTGADFVYSDPVSVGVDIPYPSFNIFVSKLDGNGNMMWTKGMGAPNYTYYGYQKSVDIALDSDGNIYTTGGFQFDVDFDPGPNSYILTSFGIAVDDIFVSKLTNDGNFVWAKGMGSTANDTGIAIAIDNNGEVYYAGNFAETVDFDSGANTSNLTSAGDYDIFVSKLSGGATPTFTDVPFNHPLHDYIESLYDNGYTAGCSTDPLMYCPDTILDRAQSAVFMLRGQMGSGYTPPAAPWNTFGDDWTGFEWAEPWAEGMYQEGLTTGCQTSPLLYCPANQLPRVEASIFGLRMKYGVGYTPPAASGTLFADFPSTDPSYWAIDWAEQAYLDGLLPACGTDSATGKPMFCPSQLVDRGWGAYLIVKAKNLPLP